MFLATQPSNRALTRFLVYFVVRSEYGPIRLRIQWIWRDSNGLRYLLITPFRLYLVSSGSPGHGCWAPRGIPESVPHGREPAWWPQGFHEADAAGVSGATSAGVHGKRGVWSEDAFHGPGTLPGNSTEHGGSVPERQVHFHYA